MPKAKLLPLLAIFAAAATASLAQAAHPTSLTDQQLDPTRQLTALQLESATHKPLPEQYIWTKEDAVPDHPAFDGGWQSRSDEELGQHYFRRTFNVDAVPQQATLYIAGPRSSTIYLNGHAIQSFQAALDSPLGIRVFTFDVTRSLQQGKNVLAIEAVRGPNIGSGADNRLSVQQTRGKVMIVKILPAPLGVEAAPLLISDAQWKTSMRSADGWQNASFDDQSWPAADSLGGIESSIEFLQWNADAGLYNWPGYDGISPFLQQFTLSAVKLLNAYPGTGRFDHLDALTSTSADSANEFSVHLPEAGVNNTTSPQLMLDFGREVNGRLEFTSDSGQPAEVTVQYGESADEALHDPYLGVDPVHVPAHATAYGPKSAFRYALVHFTGGGDTRFKSIQLAGINYPVTYKGSFESSDPRLNRMWAIGAYTAHLCMLDDIWDAPKRDRGRWMGDLDVSGRTIEDSFDDHFLMEETLDKLLGASPVKNNVNGIAGYSAFWITGEAQYYRSVGNMQQLQASHTRLVELMRFMQTELDSRNLYANNTHSWPFIDWSPDLNGDTPEARRATQFEFYGAFREGVYLLRELNDTANADAFSHVADQLKAAAQKNLLDPSGSFGSRWQTNAYAVLSGTADPSQYDAIWRNSLSTVGHIEYNALIVTPYYNYYVISAMAKMGHRADALAWIRQYWGGMVDEGATSFWEGYDPAWYKDNFHASLQADNMSGYRISLAHGWSTGVTPWLMEEVLGIHPQGAGFKQVDIRPDLVGLDWAKGGEPTPRGMLSVSITNKSGMETTIDLPAGTEARVSVPVSHSGSQVMVNGKPQSSTAAEGSSRAIVTLTQAGHYVLSAQ